MTRREAKNSRISPDRVMAYEAVRIYQRSRTVARRSTTVLLVLDALMLLLLAWRIGTWL